MGEITIEQAAKCPKCGVLGRLHTSRKTFAEGGEPCDIATYHCVTEACSWYGTGWAVQSDSRGMVYQRDQGTRGQDKTFNPLSREAMARGQRQVEDLMQRDLRDKDEDG